MCKCVTVCGERKSKFVTMIMCLCVQVCVRECVCDCVWEGVNIIGCDIDFISCECLNIG